MPAEISTEQFVSIETIKDDTVVLKDGSLRAVIMVSGINFDLKSEDEQNLIIGSFQSLLNRLDFSVQFITHSRKLNIDSYLRDMGKRSEKEENPLLKNQTKEYISFISSLVNVANVMSKRFYVVVPYSVLAVEAEETISKLIGFLPFGKGSSANNEANKKKENFESQKIQLKHRVDSVMAGLRSTGVRSIRLETEDLLELYYNLYNPEKKEKKIPKIFEDM